MRNRVASVLTSAIVVIGCLVAPAEAQQPTSSQDYDLSAAVVYDVTMNEYNLTSNVGLHADVAQRFLTGSNMSASAVGEIGLNHFENDTLSSYMGGIRFSGSYSRKFSPFAQVLLGVEHCCGYTDFAIQPGGGVDITASRRFAVRAQVDWRHVTQTADDADGLRVAVGLVFPLSR